MKKLSEMSKGQLKYETKRAFKNGMTIEGWIDHKNNKNVHTLYHYTKGVHIQKILDDGYIDIEKGSFRKDPKNAYYGTPRLLWMTREEFYPPCCLPWSPYTSSYYPSALEGVYRFSLKSDQFPNIKRFKEHRIYRQISSRRYNRGSLLDRFIETSGGCNTDHWYVSENQISVENLTLEKLTNASWVDMDSVPFHEKKVFFDIISNGKGTWKPVHIGDYQTPLKLVA